MRLSTTLVIVSASAVLTGNCGCAPGESQMRLLRRVEPQTGQSYWLIEPAATDQPVPLIVVCPARPGLAAAAETYQAWRGLARDAAAVVVIPDLRCISPAELTPPQRLSLLLADDRGVRAVLQGLARRWHFDRQRTAIVGHGAGGYASLLIGLRGAGLYTTIVASGWQFSEGAAEAAKALLNPAQQVVLIHLPQASSLQRHRHARAYKWLEEHGFASLQEWPALRGERQFSRAVAGLILRRPLASRSPLARPASRQSPRPPVGSGPISSAPKRRRR
ncbi:MAG: hypothetical protein ACE5K7_05525 [Phycisphaerae bacterium]